MVGPLNPESIIGLFLTGSLVWLYHQQRNILDRQAKLSESNHRAILRVRTYYMASWRDLYSFNKETGISMSVPGFPDRYASFSAYISNAGKGTAEDIRAELVIRTSGIKLSMTSTLGHMTNMDQQAFNQQGGILSPDDGECLMTTHFSMESDKLSDEIDESSLSVDGSLTPSEVLWLLEDIGKKHVDIGIFIHYKDGTGDREPIQLLTSKHELTSYSDIRTAYEHGGPVEENVEPNFGYN